MMKPLEKRQGWSKERVDEYNKYRIKAVLEADFDLVIMYARDLIPPKSYLEIYLLILRDNYGCFGENVYPLFTQKGKAPTGMNR
jgi:hypothetical protein